MAAIGDADLDALRNSDIEAVMQLPYFNYFIPLSVCVFAVMIVAVVGFVVFARTINTWERKHENG